MNNEIKPEIQNKKPSDPKKVKRIKLIGAAAVFLFLVIIIGGLGFIKLLTNLFQEGAALAFNGVSKKENYVLSADYYKLQSYIRYALVKEAIL